MKFKVGEYWRACYDFKHAPKIVSVKEVLADKIIIDRDTCTRWKSKAWTYNSWSARSAVRSCELEYTLMGGQ